MDKHCFMGGIGLAAALAAAAPAWSQSIPTPAQIDSGAAQRRGLEQRRELEQQGAPRETVTDPLQVEPPAAPAAAPAGQVRFPLAGVRLNDSAFLGREELTAIVRPWIGKEVGFADLQQIVSQINAAYRARGIATAQAVLPPQDVAGGVVQIQLVEGRLGGIALEHLSYTEPDFIRARVPLEDGKVVDTQALEQALVRFNRTSEIQLKAALRPGTAFGTTDVVLDVLEPPRNQFQLFADNQGVESTGEYQLGFVARRNGLLGRDDQASLYLVGSDGTWTGSAGYTVAVNRGNGRLGVSYARNTLEIVKGPFAALDITGESSTFALTFRQPLKVEAAAQWDMLLSASRSDSKTRISGVPFSDSTVDKLSAGATYDRSAGWGRWLTTHTLSYASVDSPSESWPSFVAYTGSLNVLAPLGWGTLALNAGWQWLNDDQAPASEQFQVGGLYSVRGYAQGIAAATRGYFAQLELHRQLAAGLDGFVFADFGAVMPEPKERIAGVGAGISYRPDQRWTINVSYGHALKEIVPDQDSGRLDARVVFSF